MSYYDRFKNSRAQRHSGKSKFRQDGSYGLKTIDQNRIDWRRRKGFTKDQSKGDQFCKCGVYLKQEGNRLDRRHVKRLIQADRFDEIFYHQDQWVSSWDAC